MRVQNFKCGMVRHLTDQSVYINNLDCLCSDSKQLPLLSQFVAATSYEVYEFLKIGELTPADRRVVSVYSLIHL